MRLTYVEVVVRLENESALLWGNLKSSSKGWLAIAKLKPLSLFIFMLKEVFDKKKTVK